MEPKKALGRPRTRTLERTPQTWLQAGNWAVHPSGLAGQLEGPPAASPFPPVHAHKVSSMKSLGGPIPRGFPWAPVGNQKGLRFLKEDSPSSSPEGQSPTRLPDLVTNEGESCAVVVCSGSVSGHPVTISAVTLAFQCDETLRLHVRLPWTGHVATSRTPRPLWGDDARRAFRLLRKGKIAKT